MRVARSLCDIRGIRYPARVAKFPLREQLATITRAFERGIIEISDFLNEMEKSRELCECSIEEAVATLATMFPGAARSVAESYNISNTIRMSGPEFKEPSCNANGRLHKFGGGTRILVADSSSNVEAALASIQKSEFLVAKVTTMTRKHCRKEMTQFAWRTDDAFIMLVLGEMDQEMIADFVRDVREMTKDRRILVWDPPHFHEATVRYVLPFAGITDVAVVANKVKFNAKSWETMSQTLTGGPMCTRGTFLPGSSCPSAIALEHENIRLSMLYEFHKRFSGAIKAAEPTPPSVRFMERRVESK